MKIIILFCIAILIAIMPLSAKQYLYTGSTNPWVGRLDGTIIKVSGDVNSVLNTVQYNDEVWIASGNYSTTATIALKAGVQVYGGFDGTEQTISDRKLRDADNGVIEPWEFKFPTIINGVGVSGSTVSYAIFNNSTFFILNGISIDGHNTSNANGGAIYSNARPIISKCIIRNIKSSGSGAAIFSNSIGGAYISNCLIENCVGSNGGAIFVNRKASVIQCVLRNNQAAKGGAIFLGTTTDATTNNYIINNAIYNNTATTEGGAIYINGQAADPCNIYNNTIVNNLALSSTGGIIGIQSASKLYNNIIYNNFEGTTSKTVKNLRTTLTTPKVDLQYSAYNGGLQSGGSTFSTTGNIDNLSVTDFVNTSTTIGFTTLMPADVKAANFTIQSNSIFNNSGISVAGIPSIDLLGNGRPVGTAHDIGAYEYQTNTGTQPAKTYEHFIIYGQSLSVGYQSYPTLSTQNLPGNYMIGDQVWKNYGNNFDYTQFNPLVGSIDNAEKNNANIMNRSAGTSAECPLISTVNHLQLKNPGNNILATSCGTGGRTIEQLSKECQQNSYYSVDFLSSIYTAKEISNFTNSKISCPAIIYMQGENNYSVVTTPGGVGLTVGVNATGDKNLYKSFLLTLKNNMQTDIQNLYQQTEKPLFISYQVGAQYTRGKELTIGMAQLEASNENDDVICAGPVYPMTDRGGHLDSNGYRWYGELLGKVFYETKVLNKVFRPLQPSEISRTNLSNQLKLKFNVTHLPLVMDGLTIAKVTNYGFDVWLNNVQQTITAVSVVGDCVYLTCQLPLIGDVEVIYAGSNTSGSGNLRDSDPYQAFFKYTDLDKKNDDGSFFYPRDATETTLRPSYEPKNSTGNVIYNQTYPLYNFSVAFYYKLLTDQQIISVGATGTTEVLGNIFDQKVSIHQSGDFMVISNIQNKKIKLNLYGVSGLLVKSVTLGNEVTNKFSMAGLPYGLYIANIESSGMNETLKLIYNQN
jgi:hypothetical protein